MPYNAGDIVVITHRVGKEEENRTGRVNPVCETNVEMKSGRFPKTDACKQDGRCFTDDLTKGDKAAVESKSSLEVFMAS